MTIRQMARNARPCRLHARLCRAFLVSVTVLTLTRTNKQRKKHHMSPRAFVRNVSDQVRGNERTVDVVSWVWTVT